MAFAHKCVRGKFRPVFARGLIRHRSLAAVRIERHGVGRHRRDRSLARPRHAVKPRAPVPRGIFPVLYIPEVPRDSGLFVPRSGNLDRLRLPSKPPLARFAFVAIEIAHGYPPVRIGGKSNRKVPREHFAPLPETQFLQGPLPVVGNLRRLDLPAERKRARTDELRRDTCGTGLVVVRSRLHKQRLAALRLRIGNWPPYRGRVVVVGRGELERRRVERIGERRVPHPLGRQVRHAGGERRHDPVRFDRLPHAVAGLPPALEHLHGRRIRDVRERAVGAPFRVAEGQGGKSVRECAARRVERHLVGRPLRVERHRLALRGGDGRRLAVGVAGAGSLRLGVPAGERAACPREGVRRQRRRRPHGRKDVGHRLVRAVAAVPIEGYLEGIPLPDGIQVRRTPGGKERRRRAHHLAGAVGGGPRVRVRGPAEERVVDARERRVEIRHGTRREGVGHNRSVVRRDHMVHKLVVLIPLRRHRQVLRRHRRGHRRLPALERVAVAHGIRRGRHRRAVGQRDRRHGRAARRVERDRVRDLRPLRVQRHGRTRLAGKVPDGSSVRIRRAAAARRRVPAGERVVRPRERIRRQARRRIVGHRQRRHRPRAAVRVEHDGIGVRRPMGIERLAGRDRHLGRRRDLRAAARRRVPAVERIARARGRGQRTVRRVVRHVLLARRAVRQAPAAVQAEAHRIRLRRDRDVVDIHAVRLRAGRLVRIGCLRRALRIRDGAVGLRDAVGVAVGTHLERRRPIPRVGRRADRPAGRRPGRCRKRGRRRRAGHGLLEGFAGRVDARERQRRVRRHGIVLQRREIARVEVGVRG